MSTAYYTKTDHLKYFLLTRYGKAMAVAFLLLAFVMTAMIATITMTNRQVPRETPAATAPAKVDSDALYFNSSSLMTDTAPEAQK